MKRPPENYIVKIQDSFLAEFLYYWIQHDKVCSLLFQKPSTDGLTAIKLIIDSDESAEFLQAAKNATGCKTLKK